MLYILLFFQKTESSENRRKFVISAVKLLNKYNFDGFDLAWQFPKTRIPIVRNVLSSFWQGLKKRLGYGKFHDKQEGLHRDGFTILIQMLEDELKPRNKTLSLSILPHVNASGNSKYSLLKNFFILMRDYHIYFLFL